MTGAALAREFLGAELVRRQREIVAASRRGRLTVRLRLGNWNSRADKCTCPRTRVFSHVDEARRRAGMRSRAARRLLNKVVARRLNTSEWAARISTPNSLHSPAHRENSLRASKETVKFRSAASLRAADRRKRGMLENTHHAGDRAYPVSHGPARLAGSASLRRAAGSRRPHHVESVVLFPSARLRAETRTSHRSLYSPPSPYSSSSRFFLRMNAEWTGASGRMRPSAPHSAIRLNGIVGRSAIRCNSARKSETMPRSLVSTVAASE